MSSLQVVANQPLKNLNTFGFDVSAEFFVRTSSDDELREAIEFAKNRSKPLFILGGGSNLVLTRNIPGLTAMQQHQLIEIEAENDEAVLLRASAAVNWHSLVLICVERGFYGLENLSLIPGTAGAAPIQNIGAYGVELADVLSHVEALEIATGKKIILQNADCEFAYRESIFKAKHRNQFIITDIYLRLGKVKRFNLQYAALARELDNISPESLTLETVSAAVCRIRQSKLPSPETIGNAGSFFKNPVLDTEQLRSIQHIYPDLPAHEQQDKSWKVPAAWLLETAGWKGHRDLDVGVHQRQALVLVNYGKGNGTAIIDLAEKIQADIAKKFGVSLEIEPVVI